MWPSSIGTCISCGRPPGPTPSPTNQFAGVSWSVMRTRELSCSHKKHRCRGSGNLIWSCDHGRRRRGCHARCRRAYLVCLVLDDPHFAIIAPIGIPTSPHCARRGQAPPPPRDPIRRVDGRLSRLRRDGHDSTLSATSRSVKQDLGGESIRGRGSAPGRRRLRRGPCDMIGDVRVGDEDDVASGPQAPGRSGPEAVADGVGVGGDHSSESNELGIGIDAARPTNNAPRGGR